MRRLARPGAGCADELCSLLHTSILSCASNQVWCKQRRKSFQECGLRGAIVGVEAAIWARSEATRICGAIAVCGVRCVVKKLEVLTSVRRCP